jgi:hypothetical protein
MITYRQKTDSERFEPKIDSSFPETLSDTSDLPIISDPPFNGLWMFGFVLLTPAALKIDP